MKITIKIAFHLTIHFVKNIIKVLTPAICKSTKTCNHKASLSEPSLLIILTQVQ